MSHLFLIYAYHTTLSTLISQQYGFAISLLIDLVVELAELLSSWCILLHEDTDTAGPDRKDPETIITNVHFVRSPAQNISPYLSLVFSPNIHADLTVLCIGEHNSTAIQTVPGPTSDPSDEIGAVHIVVQLSVSVKLPSKYLLVRSA